MTTDQLDIKVYKLFRLNGNQPMKAFVDISVNDQLLIKGLRIVDSKKGIFVSMPQEQGKDKKWYDQVKCLSDDIQDHIEKTVLDAYRTQ